MTKVVLITKAGTVKTETIKNVNLKELYKKCKFRKPDDFEKRHTWKHENKWVSVYSKNTGRANSENKYDLPPPIDSDLNFEDQKFLKIYVSLVLSLENINKLSYILAIF